MIFSLKIFIILSFSLLILKISASKVAYTFPSELLAQAIDEIKSLGHPTSSTEELSEILLKYIFKSCVIFLKKPDKLNIF